MAEKMWNIARLLQQSHILNKSTKLKSDRIYNYSCSISFIEQLFFCNMHTYSDIKPPVQGGGKCWRQNSYRWQGLTYSTSQIASELNLPSIALRLLLGLNRLRLSIVYMSISSAFGLHDFPLLHRAVKLTRADDAMIYHSKSR